MASPMPLEPPVISAAREAKWISSSRQLRRGRLCEPRVKDARRRRAPASRLLAFAAIVSSRRAFAAVLLACALVAGGCGGDDDEDGASQPPPEATAGPVPARARARTLAELRRDLPEGGPVLAPTVSQFVDGRQPLRLRPVHHVARPDRRRARRGVRGARRRRAGARAVRGPLRVARGQAAVPERDDSHGPRRGQDALRRRRALPTSRATTRCSAWRGWTTGWWPPPRPRRSYVVVRQKQDRVPGPGDKPPRDPHADRGRRRRRPRVDRHAHAAVGDQHDADFADVIGKKPVVLAVRDAALCQSRVCGPVVDIAEQVKADYGDQRRVHPHGDLQRQRRRQGLPPAGRARSGCRPSRGCSRSTRTARSPRASRAPSAPPSWSGRSNRR